MFDEYKDKKAAVEGLCRKLKGDRKKTAVETFEKGFTIRYERVRQQIGENLSPRLAELTVLKFFKQALEGMSNAATSPKGQRDEFLEFGGAMGLILAAIDFGITNPSFGATKGQTSRQIINYAYEINTILKERWNYGLNPKPLLKRLKKISETHPDLRSDQIEFIQKIRLAFR